MTSTCGTLSSKASTRPYDEMHQQPDKTRALSLGAVKPKISKISESNSRQSGILNAYVHDCHQVAERLYQKRLATEADFISRAGEVIALVENAFDS